MTVGPFLVRWTAHAYTKSAVLGLDHGEVERVVLEHDEDRRRNPGSAAWRVTSGLLVIVYSHPDHGDRSLARIVTLWRRR